jgi:D-arabinose 1-dehydrogenase-like Zn-dependent alcohol dehydrogenase
MSVMKAIAMAFFTAETRVVELERPTVDSPTDIVVQVHYSALNHAITQAVEKKFAGSFVHSRAEPLILG